MRKKLITTAVSSLMVASLLSMNTVNAAVNIFGLSLFTMGKQEYSLLCF